MGDRLRLLRLFWDMWWDGKGRQVWPDLLVALTRKHSKYMHDELWVVLAISDALDQRGPDWREWLDQTRPGWRDVTRVRARTVFTPPTADLHTCHDACPCHTGGTPPDDFGRSGL